MSGITNFNFMVKMFFKGKEVNFGDVVTYHSKNVHPERGVLEITVNSTLTEENLPIFKEAGLIKCAKDEEGCGPINTDVEYYIEKIAKRLGWSVVKTDKFLLKVHEIYPIAAFNIILREIAVELDKKYSDHIENSPEIFVLSTLDGRIVRANKSTIKNYRNFAAFRTLEDAKIACKILRNVLKWMYAKK